MFIFPGNVSPHLAKKMPKIDTSPSNNKQISIQHRPIPPFLGVVIMAFISSFHGFIPRCNHQSEYFHQFVVKTTCVTGQRLPLVLHRSSIAILGLLLAAAHLLEKYFHQPWLREWEDSRSSLTALELFIKFLGETQKRRLPLPFITSCTTREVPLPLAQREKCRCQQPEFRPTLHRLSSPIEPCQKSSTSSHPLKGFTALALEPMQRTKHAWTRKWLAEAGKGGSRISRIFPIQNNCIGKRFVHSLIFSSVRQYSLRK